MRILAHRGASGYAPENTLAAFDLACGMSIAALETDVRLTRDGVPVLIHDERVDRTTNGSGAVAELDWSEIAELDAGGWYGEGFAGERVPRLDAFLDRYAGKIGLCLEAKCASAVEPLVEQVRARGLHRDAGIEFTSFEWDAAVRLHEAFPRLPVGLLVRQKDMSLDLLHRTAEAGLAMFCPSIRALTAELVAAAGAVGLLVRPWGVKTREQLQHAIDCRVDGMTLDSPDWAKGQASPHEAG